MSRYLLTLIPVAGATIEVSGPIPGGITKSAFDPDDTQFEFLNSFVAAVNAGEEIDTDILSATIGMEPSSGQKSAIEAYIQAIKDGWDTSSVETAIGALEPPE